MGLLSYKISYSFFLPYLLIILLHASTTSGELLYQICGSVNYTANSPFQSNLNQLLPSLSSNGSSTGFFNDTKGQTPDRIYGLVLCRGDVKASECSSCLDTAQQDILQLCPYTKSAIVWYDQCLLRYSNQIIFSKVDASSNVQLVNTQDIPDSDLFKYLLGELMGNLSQYAANNNSSSTRNFATGEVNFTTTYPKIYGLVQCTRDLSGDQCYECLQDNINQIPSCCSGKQGGRVIGGSCNLRYEVYPFYEGASLVQVPSTTTAPALAPPPTTNSTTTAPVPPTTSSTAQGNKKNATGTVLAIAIPSVVALLLISTICICFCWRRRSAKKIPNEANPEEITSVESILFGLSTLRAATDNFSDVNKLGEGGFGAVYKGTLPGGREIAVKRLSASSGQGVGELKNELVLVAKLQHRNLVRLLGVCLEEQEKLLVYEYVPNRSLDTFLFDPIKRLQLHWERRYKIIGGIARGLLYLHEDSQLKIIHRDLKASNILLDADMNPKISDFGLARLFGGDQTQATTSRVVGTFGYMAPEYAMRGHLSIKSDMFSFGVLVLEILTGKKNSDSFGPEHDKDLLSYVWDHWTNGSVSEILDPSSGENCPNNEVLRCVQIGLMCVQEDPADRPSMSTVVLMLNSYSVTLQTPSRPAFFIGKSSMRSDASLQESDLHGGTTDQSRSRSLPMSQNEVSISELEPR